MSQEPILPPWANAQLSQRLPDICAKGEGQSVEFKETLPNQPHDIGKSLAAFASSNDGELVYGISNDGTIVGLPDATGSEARDRTAQRILNAAKDVKPPVHPTVSWAYHEGVAVCHVAVRKGAEAIYYSNYRPIVRRGCTSRPAEPGEVDQAFKLRYGSGGKAPVLPSTRDIAKRLSTVLGLMNKDRHDQLTVADLALAMGLSMPAELDAVFKGHSAPTFEMLENFCSRFAVDREWLTAGRGNPFSRPFERHTMPEHYGDLIDEEKPELVFVVRSRSAAGESFIVVQSDALKIWCVPGVWHVSRQVGATGAAQLASLRVLFTKWSKSEKPYLVLGRSIDAKLAKSIIDGETFPGVVAALPQSHWWDDLTDVEYEWTSRKGSSKAYGPGFVAAQDIIRGLLDRSL
jgi:hypothetical protein